MQAREVTLLTLMSGQRQFVIPVFQRDYSWKESQCQQLFEDVLRVAKQPDDSIHFMGSVVYVAGEAHDAVLPQWMVIDGQQRVTSCTLLLIALRDCLTKMGENVPLQDSAQALNDQFLTNPYAPQPALRTKVALRGFDNQWLSHFLLGTSQPADETSRIPVNLDLFREWVEESDPIQVLKGIRRLMVVSVSLKPGQDNPQLIFESLNSTGLSLTQADLVRNYVLMGHAEAVQTDWYEKYWRPLEVVFGADYRDLFDNFLRDFLTLETRPAKPLKLDTVYRSFRHWYQPHLNFPAHQQEGAKCLQRLLRFGRYFCKFSLGPAGGPRLESVMARLRSLVDVAAPLIMVLYDCHEERKTLSDDDFVEAVEIIESYVFRRSVIGAETRGGGTLFLNLSHKINRDDPLPSLKAQLARMGRGMSFPTDAEFMHGLTHEDMYNRRNAFYMLERLTNSGKEKVQLKGLSIEHVLPQKERLSPEWQKMLGPEWKEKREIWLHRLGNLTLTGFNSEFQAKPFLEKRDLNPGGYAHSPIWLNKSLADCDVWNAETIQARGEMLAKKALKIWRKLEADPAAIRQAELEEEIERAKEFSVDKIPCSKEAKPVFDELANYTREIAQDVVELPQARSVAYRAPTWFVELIPKAKRVYLRLAVDPEDVVDIAEVDSTEDWEFVVNSAVSGGSLISVWCDDELDVAKQLIQRAYELVRKENALDE